MKRIPLNALAKALYKRLTEHQDIPVYDDVTVEAKAPYITMGLFTCKDTGTKVNDICDASISLDIWSGYSGRKEVNSIANDIITLIQAAPFNDVGDGFRIMGTDVDFFESYAEEDYGYHGTITFIFKVQNMEE